MRHLAQFALLGALCVFGAQQAAASEHAIVGTWKVVSFQTVVDSEAPQNLYGSQPKGYLILTREGRMMAITTAENRKGGMSDAERVALHKTLVAYSGRYRIEGSDFITTVDASWNEFVERHRTEAPLQIRSRQAVYRNRTAAKRVVRWQDHLQQGRV